MLELTLEMMKTALFRCLQKSVNLVVPIRFAHGLPAPQLDWDYLLDPTYRVDIQENIKRRKGIGNIDEVIDLHEKCSSMKDSKAKAEISDKLTKAALLIPNTTHPEVPHGKYPTIVQKWTNISSKAEESFITAASRAGLTSYGQTLTNIVFGPRSYSLIGHLALLERALVNFTLDKLKTKGWKYVSVPDLIPEDVISRCGFITTGSQNQIFRISEDQGGLCLAGTAEMPLAALVAGRHIESLPLKFCTVSTCYRAEEAKNKVDKDFYRLFQFTKVEMFAITAADQSDQMLKEVIDTQWELFSELGLSLQLLDMPSVELGSPAARKFDIEAWMGNKKHWGEISSASNCTDFQSRRLCITGGSTDFPHTVNGTACAVPRMLIALMESCSDGESLPVPKVLQKQMKRSTLGPHHDTHRLKPLKSREPFQVE